MLGAGCSAGIVAEACEAEASLGPFADWTMLFFGPRSVSSSP